MLWRHGGKGGEGKGGWRDGRRDGVTRVIQGWWGSGGTITTTATMITGTVE